MRNVRTNWYLYALGLAIGVPGAWKSIEALRNGQGLSWGWVACLVGVYFIQRAYVQRRPNINSKDCRDQWRISDDQTYYLFGKRGWHILYITMAISFVLFLVIFFVLLFLATHETSLSESYSAGLVGVYALVATGSVWGLCLALVTMRFYHGLSMPKK